MLTAGRINVDISTDKLAAFRKVVFLIFLINKSHL